MPKNNQYNTYDNAANENLFSDSSLDERQRSESYCIAFKIFRAMFYTCLMLSLIIVIMSDGIKSVLLKVMGLILMTVLYGFYVLYAALTAAKGIMPESFAKRCAKKSFVIGICALEAAALVFFAASISDAAQTAYITIVSVMNIILHFLARHNFKVLKKQTEEEEQ